MPEDRDKFAVLRRCVRVWAVASIHGEVDRLIHLHDRLAERIVVGDRLVYLGNYLGRGPAVAATIDCLLDFRRWLITAPTMFVSDVVFLRGAQEEMWRKLLQLQFAPNPREVYGWMLNHGIGPTIAAYGVDPEAGLAQARAGVVQLTRWTSQLRAAVKSRPGHEALMAALRRAAYTDDGALLFVHAGVDPARPLSAQSDSLWWATTAFSRIDRPIDGFRRVIRGFDPEHRGVTVGEFTVSVDAGCGFGGPLIAVCLDPTGDIVDVIEA